ncbi:CHASE2 domain-containing protein [Aerosakkonemataceae cyanobacterium BLCC-F154]|uniref:non-specific serine/threonine protein kinase n=1 Tax=Floridaenema fluviatile BLCC-F154 TaxID=3153640 RepID=A0ABV4YIA0_9CYAN
MSLDPALLSSNLDETTTELPPVKSKLTSSKPTVKTSPRKRFNRWGHVFAGLCAAAAAIATGMNGKLVQNFEYEIQNLFFQLRGPVAPPDNIVILAIDNDTLSIPQQLYQINPQENSNLEPLQGFPFKRTAYAEVINKLMAAGAKSVSVNVEFVDPSSYGTADDRRLKQTLQRYAGRITLPVAYDESNTPTGPRVQLIEPLSLLQTNPISLGSINYLLEPNGKIHRLSSAYRQKLAENYKHQLQATDNLKLRKPGFDFAEATLQAARIAHPPTKGDLINFSGPKGTFNKISFWQVLSPKEWQNISHEFKDKIVLIGATDTSLKDFYPTPFSPDMPGVEIHANAIATLQQGTALAKAIPNSFVEAVLVLIGVSGAAIILNKQKSNFKRLSYTTGIIIAWGSISYIAFIHGYKILPTAMPIMAIALTGISYSTTEAAQQKVKKLLLHQTLKRYATSPIVKQIISQQDDLADLLPIQDLESSSKTVGGRYEIIKILGAGGFGETYIAQDTQRPGNPLCVVKQLKPDIHNPKHLDLARRLFPREAEALERLGKHDQIPQLLAYFEENEEFYLVQEFIDGHSLEDELPQGKQLSEAEVINMLKELLPVLEFVHNNGVIHRDIKPNNIIRRHCDRKLVLIDFGAVKQISTQVLNSDGSTRFTVAIGTQGYAPSEQCSGRPRPNSDIYALGITAIKALTGVSPTQLIQDTKTGEILWTHKVQVSPELAAIVSKMVYYDFNQRYQTATEVIEDLLNLANSPNYLSPAIENISERTDPIELNSPTRNWTEYSLEITEASEQEIDTKNWTNDSLEMTDSSATESPTKNWSVESQTFLLPPKN